MIIGLDLATRSGIAVLDGETITVSTHKGTPIELLSKIESIIRGERVEKVIIERHVHFLNAKTTRSLIGRIGYIEWSLRKNGHDVIDLFPKKRKELIASYSALGYDKDEYDAIILINEWLARSEPFVDIRRAV